MEPFLTYNEIKIRRQAVAELLQKAHDARSTHRARREARRRKRASSTGGTGVVAVAAEVPRFVARPSHDNAS